MDTFISYGLILGLCAGGLVITLLIAVPFFRVKERIELQKETNRLLKKIAGE